MKTTAFILVCVSAVVCFCAAHTPARESGHGGESYATSAWAPYFTPAEADTTGDAPGAARNYVEEIDLGKCTCRGIKLYGKVRVVESFADLKVQIVGSFPDLKVKTVGSFPDDCGEWQFVESFPDFTIKYVESFPDVKIKFVESFPGM